MATAYGVMHRVGHDGSDLQQNSSNKEIRVLNWQAWNAIYKKRVKHFSHFVLFKATLFSIMDSFMGFHTRL